MSANRITKSEENQFYEESSRWAVERYTKALNSASRWKKFGIASLIFGGLACGSVMFLLPLKQIEPVVITVESTTGQYTVNKKGFQVDIDNPRNEIRMFKDLADYVNAREGFTRGEAEKIYNQAYLMSCSSVRGEVSNYFSPKLNPRSPVNTMALNDQDEVEIINYTFLPTDKDDIKVAQVKYDLTEKRNGRKRSKQRFVSTITFNYDKKNIPKKKNDLALNAFGFCALNYRKSPEGEKINLEQVRNNYMGTN